MDRRSYDDIMNFYRSNKDEFYDIMQTESIPYRVQYFAVTSDGIEIYQWSNSSKLELIEFVSLHKLIEPYFYVGSSILHSVYGNQQTDVLTRLRNADPGESRYYIMKFSINHAHGPWYAFLEAADGYSYNHLYTKEAISLWPRDPRYLYTKYMEAISFECYVYDSNGELLDVFGELTPERIHKSYFDFANPVSFEQMLQTRYPFLWIPDAVKFHDEPEYEKYYHELDFG